MRQKFNQNNNIFFCITFQLYFYISTQKHFEKNLNKLAIFSNVFMLFCVFVFLYLV